MSKKDGRDKINIRTEIEPDLDRLLEILTVLNDSSKSEEVRNALKDHVYKNKDRIKERIEYDKDLVEELTTIEEETE